MQTMFHDLLLPGVLFLVGVSLGWLSRIVLGRTRIEQVRGESRDILNQSLKEAEHHKRQALLQAREEWLKTKARLDQELQNRALESDRREQALEQRESGLREKDARVRSRERALEQRERETQEVHTEARRERDRSRRLAAELGDQLSRVSGLTTEDAKQMLLESLRQEVRVESARMIREARDEAQKKAETEACKIVSLAIERTASEWTAERSVTAFQLPSEKLKGRIIGHEGKNIRAFEKATGVQLLIDEQPDTVVLSCFNPIKREIARLTLDRLVRDGNIHPRRIEDLVQKNQRRVEELMLRAGQEALKELGITGVHPELVRILGRLRYRTSYGQNVLMHSIEVAKLTAIMASELRLDGALAKRAGLFHDIGKAIDFEREGTHPEIGVEVATRYNEHPVVINAIGTHHEDADVANPISVLVSAADAISGSRPGARRKNVVDYVRRIEQLEGLANEMEGVEQSYAIQAGREIRVIARAEKVSDDQLAVLASDLARKIQAQMEYPGRIKVTVIREMRATATAH
ncbi:MAG TPA: ribonuclease Y [Candidatus Polarisedimenticolia bacterium]|jgi:ribonuclease Y|nr:ribonuclease Y [Candidatus Polarisedimenticolia bacterium]